jgi:CMP-N,N'-diacetyllegionaminic acid synthase
VRRDLPYTLAIIPARGGSKGLSRKNLALLGGLPLVAWSIRSALACPGIHRVLVSTEDEQIAGISREHGAEVPFLRPAYLAGDAACLGDVIHHAVQQLDGPAPDVVVILLPTHPFRTPELMRHMTAQAQAGYGRVSTVAPVRVHAASHLVMDRRGRLASIFEDQFPPEAVDKVSLHRHYGLFYAYAEACPKSRIYNFEITDPVELIDIDTPEDLELARMAVAEDLFSLERLK